MIKRLASAAVLGLLMTGAALAQSAPAAAPATAPTNAQEKPAPAQPAPAAQPSDPAPAAETQATMPTVPGDAVPGTQEACIATATTLGTTAEGKTIAEDKLEQLDQLFSRLETLCDGRQFAEAMIVAKDIKTMLDVQ